MERPQPLRCRNLPAAQLTLPLPLLMPRILLQTTNTTPRRRTILQLLANALDAGTDFHGIPLRRQVRVDWSKAT